MTAVVTAVVAGVGRSRFSRRSGATEMSLAAQAIAAALRDAKLAPRDVDGVVRFDRDALWEYDLPGVCGVTNLGFYNAVPAGPGGAPALLRMAAMAITEGLASVVLCHHARDGVARTVPPPAVEAAWLARLQRVNEAELPVRAGEEAVEHRQPQIRLGLRHGHRTTSFQLSAPKETAAEAAVKVEKVVRTSPGSG